MTQNVSISMDLAVDLLCYMNEQYSLCSMDRQLRMGKMIDGLNEAILHPSVHVIFESSETAYRHTSGDSEPADKTSSPFVKLPVDTETET